MNKLYPTVALTVAVMLSASCAKNENSQTEQPGDGPFEISITGEMAGFDTSTKSAVKSCIRMEWNTTTNDGEKDVVWVYGYDKEGTAFKSLSTEGLKATSSADNPYTATLSGTITEIPKDGNLYLVHCPTGTYSQPSISTSSNTGSVTIDMSEVEQSSSVTPFIVYSTVNVSGEELNLNDLTAKFNFATSVIKVNITGLGTSASLDKAYVTHLNKNCTLYFNEGEATVAAAAETPEESDLGIYTKDLSETATGNGKAVFLLGVPAISANSGRTVILTSGERIFTETGVFPKEHPNNNYVNTICTVSEYIYDIVFSVSDTKKVKFTKGNLWWGKKGSETAPAWHLEENQYDWRTWSGFNSCIDGNVTDTGTPEGDVGLFYWTSTAKSSRDTSYVKYGDYFFIDGYDNSRKLTAEDTLSGLYAMSKNDWDYLLFTRDYVNKFAKAKIKSVNGLLIFPDGYYGTLSETGISKINKTDADYPDTSIPDAAWNAMEEEGCIFIPVVGRREYITGSHKTEISGCNNADGFYWTSTIKTEGYSYYMAFNENVVNVKAGTTRNYGLPVRPVYDVE